MLEDSNCNEEDKTAKKGYGASGQIALSEAVTTTIRKLSSEVEVTEAEVARLGTQLKSLSRAMRKLKISYLK